MSYTINVKLIQTNPEAWFEIVEKTVFHYANGGTWTEKQNMQVLTMGGSGTSGLLRLQHIGDPTHIVAFVLGVHNYEHWSGIATALTPGQTGVEIHPTYYAGGERSKDFTLGATNEKADSWGRKYKVDFYKKEGNTFDATITIS
ncbi:hypothetical protein PHLCEN_2v949 [Hermanssonia centrifuga]|uniref:Lectin n=1 Tax=Hermanssonia centrifuga TaxID=98765 RepID=A0A2R6S4I8_9APHY|nr:hypothetical protein PHLCEN_2v949 [Hermanssonia centrifuga]